MKKNNYHTHTYRCGHASGNEEDMLKAAMIMNLDAIGISEHVPLPKYRFHLLKSIPFLRSFRSLFSLVRSFVSGGPQMRMPYKDLEEHLRIVSDLKEKYKDQIEVYQGFEAEGLSEYFDYYHSLLAEGKVDYLILGHHFHKHCIHDDYFGKNHITKKDIYHYCNDVERALETGLFSYLAHPDLFLMGYQDYDIDMKTVSRRICEKAKSLNIPLEINAGGMRRGLQNIGEEMLYLYPNAHFWDIASEVGNDVILGFDAHDPSDFNDAMYKEMKKFAKEHRLHILEHIEFLKGKKDI